MMLEKEVNNEQISNLLYTDDVLKDIIFEYTRTIPFTAKIHPEEIAEYAKNTGKEMFENITPAHFAENKKVMDCIDEHNTNKWMLEMDRKYEALELLVVDIMDNYIEDNPSVTEIECKELFRYAKWSGKEDYQNLEYSVLTDEYILDRIEEFNDVLRCIKSRENNPK